MVKLIFDCIRVCYVSFILLKCVRLTCIIKRLLTYLQSPYPYLHKRAIVIVTSFATELATPTVTDVRTDTLPRFDKDKDGCIMYYGNVHDTLFGSKLYRFRLTTMEYTEVTDRHYCLFVLSVCPVCDRQDIQTGQTNSP